MIKIKVAVSKVGNRLQAVRAMIRKLAAARDSRAAVSKVVNVVIKGAVSRAIASS